MSFIIGVKWDLIRVYQSAIGGNMDFSLTKTILEMDI